jgi:ParB-like chromosome segregation protein Spo0J
VRRLLLAEGLNLREIAIGLGLSRNTVRRFAPADSPEELLVNDGIGRQASSLDERAAYLRERWNSGCANAAQLRQELGDADTPAARPTSARTSPASAEPPPPRNPSLRRRRSGP